MVINLPQEWGRNAESPLIATVKIISRNRGRSDFRGSAFFNGFISDDPVHIGATALNRGISRTFKSGRVIRNQVNKDP